MKKKEFFFIEIFHNCNMVELIGITIKLPNILDLCLSPCYGSVLKIVVNVHIYTIEQTYIY